MSRDWAQTPLSELLREEGLRRLQEAEGAARRALETLERHVHVARRGSDNEVLELLSTAERDAELALAALRGTRLEAAGRKFSLRELSGEEGLQVLGEAEPLARRALQTIERELYLAKSGCDNDMRKMLSTAEHEVDLVLAALKGALLETWDPVSLVTLYLSRTNAPL
jgi:hypothetical protein